MIHCLLKLFVINFIMHIIKKSKCCLNKLIGGFKIKNIEIFCYDTLSNVPGMVIPLAVMLSN